MFDYDTDTTADTLLALVHMALANLATILNANRSVLPIDNMAFTSRPKRDSHSPFMVASYGECPKANALGTLQCLTRFGKAGGIASYVHDDQGVYLVIDNHTARGSVTFRPTGGALTLSPFQSVSANDLHTALETIWAKVPVGYDSARQAAKEAKVAARMLHLATIGYAQGCADVDAAKELEAVAKAAAETVAAPLSEPTSELGYWVSLCDEAEAHVEEPEPEDDGDDTPPAPTTPPAPLRPATVPCPRLFSFDAPHVVAECHGSLADADGVQAYKDLWALQARIEGDLANVEGTSCDRSGAAVVSLEDVWDYLPEASRAYLVKLATPDGDDDNDGGSDDETTEPAAETVDVTDIDAYTKNLLAIASGPMLPAAKDPKAHTFAYQYNDGVSAPVGKGYADAIEAMRTEAKAADTNKRFARGVHFAKEALADIGMTRALFAMTLAGTQQDDCVTWEALRIIKSNRMDCVMRLLELGALADYDCTRARFEAELRKLTPEQVDNIRAIGMEEIRACNAARRELALQADNARWEAAQPADFDGRMAASNYTPKARGSVKGGPGFVDALADMLKQWNTCGYRTGTGGDFADCAVVTATRHVTVARGETEGTDKRPCDSAEAYLTYDGAGYDYLSTCADYGGIEWMREQVKAVATAWGFTAEEHSSWALAFYAGDAA